MKLKVIDDYLYNTLIMKIYLASSNKHKYQEFQSCLKNVELVIPSSENISFAPIEDGDSFLQNAMIKAKALYDIVKTPVIADDSGLCVEALDGRPGIFSARYSIPPNKEENIADYGINRLLKEMKDKKNRKAFFVCCIVLYMKENRFFIFQETCNGEITYAKNGTLGFGYDPIFFIKDLNKTMAELSADEKNKISHRGKALSACHTVLQKIKYIDN